MDLVFVILVSVTRTASHTSPATWILNKFTCKLIIYIEYIGGFLR
jgi:hypothetical protein